MNSSSDCYAASTVVSPDASIALALRHVLRGAFFGAAMAAPGGLTAAFDRSSTSRRDPGLRKHSPRWLARIVTKLNGR